ncbi:tyrosine-type recombinase/integrase [Dactylosporangium maewongense]|uniref:tyrosine-type recombinase/integrase n=1 Tax=Dactylosporangium maewongense TaxID=634393 RepID=UPI0031E4833F
MAEARRFLEHVRGDRLYPLLRLLLTTGLRRGELCGLMWRDLEPEQGSLKVCRQRIVEDPTSQVREKPPKSHNGTRTLLLDPATLTTLSTAKAHPKTPTGSRYMFTGRTGQPLRPDNVTSRFNRLAARAGVRPIGPHQVRHLLVSSLLDDEYGIREVAELSGMTPAPHALLHAGQRRPAPPGHSAHRRAHCVLIWAGGLARQVRRSHVWSSR